MVTDKPLWLTSKYKCPECNTPLFFIEDASGVTIWCGMDNKVCPNLGANEGAHSNTEKNAYDILKEKLRF